MDERTASGVGKKAGSQHLLILGEDSRMSAPSATLSRALRRAGMNVRFSNSAEQDGLRSWRRTLKDVRGRVRIAALQISAKQKFAAKLGGMIAQH